jgi:hypothetical protein
LLIVASGNGDFKDAHWPISVSAEQDTLRATKSSKQTEAAIQPSKLEDLIWKVYVEFESEMRMNKQFDPSMEYLSDPASAPLLAAPPFVSLPSNAPPQLVQQVWSQVMQAAAPIQGPVKADEGLGRIALGPFMPILSGNYNVQVCEEDIAIDSPTKA